MVVRIWLRVRLVFFPSLLLAYEPAPPPTLVIVLASECVLADGKEITGQERASYTFTDTLMDTLRESSMDP